MKLDGQEESGNVEDRRGLGRKAGVAIASGGGIIVVIVCLLLGVDPRQDSIAFLRQGVLLRDLSQQSVLQLVPGTRRVKRALPVPTAGIESEASSGRLWGREQEPTRRLKRRSRCIDNYESSAY